MARVIYTKRKVLGFRKDNLIFSNRNKGTRYMHESARFKSLE